MNISHISKLQRAEELLAGEMQLVGDVFCKVNHVWQTDVIALAVLPNPGKD